jgi:transcription-repair coupling factor (superfamily II helicase)
MLEETVRELKGETVEEGPSATIDLPVAMAIPETYVRDANLRMEIYRRIAAAEEPREALLAELKDRFGEPPAPVLTLVEVAELKRLAERLRVQGITGHRGKLTLRLRQDTRAQPETLIQMVQDRPGTSFSPTGVLTLPAPGGEATLHLAREVLELLAEPIISPQEPGSNAGEAPPS